MEGICDVEQFNPNPVLLQSAKEPPHPVLPRRQQHRQASHSRRERIPLASSLSGPGRAGTKTTLLGSNGSKYVGEVLAGRPHGMGQYWAPGPQQSQPLQLAYEGAFVRGVCHGQGTAHYHQAGEVYSGSWRDGKRNGHGKLSYGDGTVYEGMWVADSKHGVGTQCNPGGSIFVGTWVADKRQGLGVTFWGSRGKKYVAEHVNDAPVCGSMLDLDDDSVEPPPSQQLRQAIAAARVKAAGAAAAAPGGAVVRPIPPLSLVQPSQVLAKVFASVRQQREQQQLEEHAQPLTPQQNTAAPVVHPTTSTLTSSNMQLLRHAFILVAGGDDLAAHILPHQLPELVVLAGLDCAAPPVVKLLHQLQQRIAEGGRGKLFLDDLLDVVSFFRHSNLAQQQQQQQQHAEIETHSTQPEGEGGESWQEAEGVASSWGVGTGEDVLAQHIAAHRAGSS